MAIRINPQGVLNATTTDTGSASINGGIAFPFQIPMDTDNVYVKMTASISGGVSAIFQTSDDSGTTYYDVQRTSIVSNANNTNAQWLSIPVISGGVNPSKTTLSLAGSVLGGTIGSSAASTLGANQVSGLPILSTQNRIFVIYSGTIAANSIVTVQVKANSQSATA